MSQMKFGFVLPWGDARTAANLAREAELAGWDGFFVPEAIWHIDAWVALTAAALNTNRIRLGTMLSALPRMRPWKLASESATLDNLSNGRVILSLGMGALFMGYQAFPDEVTDLKTRAELLDEGIDLLNLLYQGKALDYKGHHYHLKLTAMDEQFYPPPPVQQPRIPLWVVGVWPRLRSMNRVLKCDGLIAEAMDADGQFIKLQPQHVRQMKAYIDDNRSATSAFDIIVEGQTLGLGDAQMADLLSPWTEAGATWWIETLFDVSFEELTNRLRQGPAAIYG